MEQRALVERLSAGIEALPFKTAMFVATQTVLHGLDQAEEIIAGLRAGLKHPDAVNYLDKLRGQQLNFIKGLKFWPHVKNDQALMSKLYQTDGFFFSKGTKYPHKLLVVFTTIFNNFGMSNAILYAMLRELEISVLILKDPTYFRFLNGASGLGTDFYSTIKAIRCLAGDNQISEIFVTGFSSGGYSSLYASFLLPCAGYLGLSVHTDMSRDSALPAAKNFTDKVRSKIDERHLINLRELAKSTNDRVPRRLFFGEQSTIDAAHAANMIGLPNVKVTKLASGHQTVRALIEEHALFDWFQRLLFQTSDIIRDF